MREQAAAAAPPQPNYKGLLLPSSRVRWAQRISLDCRLVLQLRAQRPGGAHVQLNRIDASIPGTLVDCSLHVGTVGALGGGCARSGE